MPKKPVSLTLDEAKLLWLRGRGYGRGNLSAVVDDLISEARAGRLGSVAPARSVVGTIDLAADDLRLEKADEVIRGLFAASLARPLRAREYPRRITVRNGPSGRDVVADLPAAVADTHALLFHATAERALGRRAAAHFEACERQQALLYIPMAVVWEVGCSRARDGSTFAGHSAGFSAISSATLPISRST